MMEIALVIVLCALALGLGWSVVIRLDPDRALTPAERPMVAIATGMAAMGTAIYLFGQFRLDMMSVLLFLAVTAVAAVPGWRTIPWRKWSGALAALQRDVLGHRLEIILWVAIIAVGLSSFLQGLAPPSDTDAIDYHLSLARMDIEEGRLVIAWEWPNATFFPILMGALTRIAFLLVSAEAAQVLHGATGFLAAGATAALAVRLGADRRVAALAAFLFLALRAVVWEMGTAEVDVAQAAFSSLAIITMLAWREKPSARLAGLLGLMIGAMVTTKYTGMSVAIALSLLFTPAIWRRPAVWYQPLAAAGVALLMFLPYGLRNLIITGNPFFPVFNFLFAPDYAIDFEHQLRIRFGLGYDLPHFLTILWDISVHPRYFDGMMLGIPYLMALLPMSVLAWRRDRPFAALFVFMAACLPPWFWFQYQQSRYLLPIYPAAAALAAVGVVAAWNALRALKIPVWPLALLCGLFVLNQGIFLASHAILRLPAALGLVSKEAYLRNTPTVHYPFYSACSWLSQHKKSDERALIWLSPVNFNCPQKNAFKHFPDEWQARLKKTGAPPMGFTEFLRAFEKYEIRYVVVQTHDDPSRVYRVGSLVRVFDDFAKTRYGRYLAPVLKDMKPLFSEERAAIYDGREVLAALKRVPRQGG